LNLVEEEEICREGKPPILSYASPKKGKRLREGKGKKDLSPEQEIVTRTEGKGISFAGKGKGGGREKKKKKTSFLWANVKKKILRKRVEEYRSHQRAAKRGVCISDSEESATFGGEARKGQVEKKRKRDTISRGERSLMPVVRRRGA